MQKHVEVSDLSFLSFPAAQEVEKLSRDAVSETHYLSSSVKRLDYEIHPDTGVKNLAPSAWRMYCNAVNEATRLEPQDVGELDRGLQEIGYPDFRVERVY